ncbi:VOC family protein [Streptomyces sp. CA-181903]|uniref:VOC family protein n=1 Tax=Streptomyces sp. CA-181903 TaxID=3240055 RepID=UPI003D91B8C7
MTAGSVTARTPAADRWFRTRPDSSSLDRPRLLARLLIDLADLDDRIAFYERLLGVPADLRMPIPDFGGLELAAVGNLLLIASERPFTPVQRRTAYSLIVPSLTGQLRLLERTGTEVLEPVEAIKPGSRARVRYPDGSLAELVEHRPQPGERPSSRPGIAVREAMDTGVRLLARRAVPADGLDEAVRFYRTALETEPEAGAPGGTAIVGNLLLTTAAATDAGPIAFTLLAPSPEHVAELAGTAQTEAAQTGTTQAEAAQAGGGAPGGPALLTLPYGTRAEIRTPPRRLPAQGTDA